MEPRRFEDLDRAEAEALLVSVASQSPTDASRFIDEVGRRRRLPAMDLLLPLTLSGLGVAIAAIAFYNREKPAWQKDMKALYILAFGQVALAAVSWFVLSR